MLRGKVTDLEKPQSGQPAFMGYDQHHVCKWLGNLIFTDNKLERKYKFSYLYKSAEQNKTGKIM
jgi:hypothetical protein